MLFRNIDADGDWTFGAGMGNMTNKSIATGLNIKTRLQSWVGDCFFDMLSCVDWKNRLGSKNQRTLLELDLRRVIIQSRGVTQLKDFATNLVGRRFVATYSVVDVYGQEITDTINL